MFLIAFNTFYSNVYLKDVKDVHLKGKWTTFGWNVLPLLKRIMRTS